MVIPDAVSASVPSPAEAIVIVAIPLDTLLIVAPEKLIVVAAPPTTAEPDCCNANPAETLVSVDPSP